MEKTNLTDFIFKKAHNLGIDAIGFGSVEKMIEYQKKYYPSQTDSILDYFPQSRVLITAALSYNLQNNQLSSDTDGYIARYTTANFYRELSKKLKKLGSAIKNALSPNTKKSDFYRVFVNSKINDKLAAYICGLGHFARNSLIFVQNRGTHFVLGELVLSINLPESPLVTKSCGQCTICQNACPTNAITSYGVIEKDKCIQHIASQKEWPLKINGKRFIDLWGKRFFGCSVCIDSCPYTKNDISIRDNLASIVGFVDKSFAVERILSLKKEDYKIAFAKNQLSASWLPPEILVRNALFSLYNQNKKELIIKYQENIDKFNWSEEEKCYIKGFCNYLVKLSSI